MLVYELDMSRLSATEQVVSCWDDLMEFGPYCWFDGAENINVQSSIIWGACCVVYEWKSHDLIHSVMVWAFLQEFCLIFKKCADLLRYWNAAMSVGLYCCYYCCIITSGHWVTLQIAVHPFVIRPTILPFLLFFLRFSLSVIAWPKFCLWC